MITNRNKTGVAFGVRYDMVLNGKVMDIVSGGGKGGIRDLMAQADAVTGMEIHATVYEIRKAAKDPEFILSRRKVYPVD